jgi:hypothetical protein
MRRKLSLAPDAGYLPRTLEYLAQGILIGIAGQVAYKHLAATRWSNPDFWAALGITLRLIHTLLLHKTMRYINS